MYNIDIDTILITHYKLHCIHTRSFESTYSWTKARVHKHAHPHAHTYVHACV